MNKHNTAVPRSLLREITGETVVTESALATSLGITTADLRQATIMLIDDEPIVIDIARAHLEEWGYEHFVELTDATKAMQAIEEQVPDIVLLDINMPDISGLAVLEQIRASDQFRHLPVVMLTAASNEEMQVDALKSGATDFLTKPVNASELALRVQNTLTIKLHHDRLTYHDALTSLPNRTLFMEKLKWELEKMHRYNRQGAVVHIDLDRFKRINDTLGYEAGDRLLQTVSQRLTHKLRTTDTIIRAIDQTSNTSLSRLEGDEFTLVIPEITCSSHISTVVQRILETMQTPFNVAGQDVILTASLGIAVYPGDGDNPEILLQRAQQATIHCQQHRRNDFEYYSSKMNAESHEKLELESSMRFGLERNEFELYYQPKVDVESGRVIGCESLIRWNHTEKGIVSPLDFIPLAEENGFIIPLGHWVLKQACQQMQAWNIEGLGSINVAVNVSARQFHDNRFIDDLKSILQETELDPAQLTLELTENMLMENIDDNIEILETIKSLGVKLSVDDFGTGYSSLSYLERFPLDELKIDRSFISPIQSENDNAPIVNAVVAMSRSLGLKTVAEGVEIEQQLAYLRKLDCDTYQGYLFSKPIPAKEFTSLIKKHSSKEAG